MDSKSEGVFAIVAAMLVLLSAMWDARISIALSVLALLGLGLYKLVKKSAGRQ